MLTPDLLSWTLGATIGINRWSSERNAKTDFEHCRVATEEGKAKYGGAQVATEDMLTPDLLSWTLGATVGIKYSKQFALNKQAQKVKYVATDIVAEEPEIPSGGGSEGAGGGGSNEGDPNEE